MLRVELYYRHIKVGGQNTGILNIICINTLTLWFKVQDPEDQQISENIEPAA